MAGGGGGTNNEGGGGLGVLRPQGGEAQQLADGATGSQDAPAAVRKQDRFRSVAVQSSLGCGARDCIPEKLPQQVPRDRRLSRALRCLLKPGLQQRQRPESLLPPSPICVQTPQGVLDAIRSKPLPLVLSPTFSRGPATQRDTPAPSSWVPLSGQHNPRLYVVHDPDAKCFPHN